MKLFTLFSTVIVLASAPLASGGAVIPAGEQITEPWAAASFLATEKSFRRIMGWRICGRCSVP